MMNAPMLEVPLYARFPRRIQALVADALVLIVSLFVAVAVAEYVVSYSLSRFILLLAFAGMFLYDPVLVSWTGSTLGQRMLNLKVVDADTGEYPSFLQALLRFVVKAFLGILSFLFMAVTQRHQALHDLALGTTVQVRDPARATSIHFTVERALDPPDLVQCGAVRRIAVAAAYLSLAFLVLMIAGLAGVSLECLDYEICTRAEETTLGIAGVTWIASAVVLPYYGWKGMLPGARATVVERTGDRT
jgi:uncharacterized RDD family membrane protein YckC